MFQIVFNSVSSSEMSSLPKLLQLEILREFQVLTPNFVEEHPDRFGEIHEKGRTIYRYRARDYRIYFEKNEQGLLIHRVIHKNTLNDFFFRSRLPVAEDEALAANPHFWRMIDDPDSGPIIKQGGDQ